MLDQVGNFKFGYRLMVGRQGGNILNSTHNASDYVIMGLSENGTLEKNRVLR